MKQLSKLSVREEGLKSGGLIQASRSKRAREMQQRTRRF